MRRLHARDRRAYPVQSLCRLFGASKQAYYQHDDDRLLRRLAQESVVVDFALSMRSLDPGIGGLKLWLMFSQAHGAEHPIGRDSFLTILDRHGLKLRQKRRRTRTTDSRHGLPVYPNLVRALIPQCANELWVSDITYVTLWPDANHPIFCYLSLVMDAYSKEIIGWSVGMTLSSAHPIEALRMALTRLPNGNGAHGLIHHSDRGCQYASAQYTDLLREHNILISMTDGGDPKQNAQAERVNGTVKNELLRGIVFRNVEELRAALPARIGFYNEQRPHMSLSMQTPAQAAACQGEQQRRWLSYRERAIKRAKQAIDDPPNEGAQVEAAS